MKTLSVERSGLVDIVKSISIQVSGAGQFARFQRMYHSDRIAFVHDILPEFAKTITFYQEEILGEFDNGVQRMAVRGPHGLGKTSLAAILVHHSILTAEGDCKVPTTASAWRQLEKYLWPEIRKFTRYIDWSRVGREPYDDRSEMLSLSLRLRGGIVEAFALASDDHNTIEGAHAERLVYIFDEAKAIPRPTWNAAEGAFSTNGLNRDGLLYDGHGKIIPRAAFGKDGGVEVIEYKDVGDAEGLIDYEEGEGTVQGNSERGMYPDNVAINVTGNPIIEYARESIQVGSNEDHSQVHNLSNNVAGNPSIRTGSVDGLGSGSLSSLPSRNVESPVPTSHVPLSQNPHHDPTSTVIDREPVEYYGNRIPVQQYDVNPQFSKYASPSGTHEPNVARHTHAHKKKSAIFMDAYIDTQMRKDSMTKVSGQDLGILGTDNPQLAQQSYGSTVNRQYEYANPVDHNNTHTNAVLTATTIQEALAFAISTPGDPVGQFYDICMHRPGYDDWKTRHVTLDEAIRAGRISREWADMREKQWGVDSALYLNRVLGEFADNSEDGIIPLSHIRMAVERWKSWVGGGRHEISGKRVMGVDTARSGEDKTVIAVGIAYRLQEIYSFAKLSVTSVAGNVTRLAQGHEVHIETDGGLGAGVYDVLKEDGLPNLRPITVSGATAFRDKSKQLKFLNVRAAMWWNMREMLDPQYGVECMLPPHEGLILDLSTPRYTIERDAVVKLESKDSIKKRLGRSTDYGDAACLMFWTAGRGGGVVF